MEEEEERSPFLSRTQQQPRISTQYRRFFVTHGNPSQRGEVKVRCGRGEGRKGCHVHNFFYIMSKKKSFFRSKWSKIFFGGGDGGVWGCRGVWGEGWYLQYLVKCQSKELITMGIVGQCCCFLCKRCCMLDLRPIRVAARGVGQSHD